MPLSYSNMNLFQKSTHNICLSRYRIYVLPVFSFYNYYLNLSGKLNYQMILIIFLSILKLKCNNIKCILPCVQLYSWALAKPFKILWIFQVIYNFTYYYIFDVLQDIVIYHATIPVSFSVIYNMYWDICSNWMLLN